MKKGLFIFLSLLFSQFVFGQQDLYVGADLIGGSLGRTELTSGLLDKKNYSPILGAQLSASFRLFDILSLEGGIGQHWNRIRLKDAAFEDEIDGFSLDIENSTIYWNYYAAASIFYKIGTTDSYVYGKFAISKNIYKEGSITETADFEVTSENIDRSLVYTSNYQGSNISYIPEVGVQHKFFKGNLLSLGFRYNLGQSEVLSSTYTITDNNTGTSKTDELSSLGNAFSFNLRFDYKLYHFAKREKVKKLKLDEIAIDVSKKKEEVNDTVTAPIEVIDTTPPVSVANRVLIIKDRVKVHSSKVLIQIWDHQTVDGDRVSLNLNGNWILENYELKKDKYEIEVELREGTNTFVLHALNLGKYKPNTAALLVIEGNKKHRIILESNLKESGTLQINYKKRKKDEQ